jgi:hypothetical protein
MKERKVEQGKTYVGVVEDNLDPNKEGRLKIRIVDVFDEAKTEDIPWASPWKDLAGGQIGIPEKGKVVICVFEQGDSYKPEYISTEHWNINLENKLKGLSDTDYTSMKSVIFDHKTQIYSNDSEGLKMDYKFNNVNIKNNGININLKDNGGLVNIGDSTANQQAILGNHFLSWFDSFIDALMNNTAFLGNAGAPVISNPALIRILGQYKAQKDSTFLSHHVNIVDNNKVSTVKLDNREEIAQSGDTWKSTKTENTLTSTSTETNKPAEGEKPPYDEKHVEPPTDKPGVSPTVQPPTKPVETLPEKSSPESNKKIEKLIWFLKNKNYTIYEVNFQLNIVAFRSKNQVKDEENSNVTNLFDEEICVFYKNEKGNWEIFEYSITTVPGYVAGKKELPEKVGILVLGQYIERLRIISYLGNSSYPALSFDQCSIHRNDKIDRYNFSAPIETGNFAMTIHRSSDVSSSEFVFNYSEGAQVFKNFNQYEQFMKICQNQIDKGGKSTFTYTLCSKKDFDEYLSPDEQRELVKTMTSTQSASFNPTTSETVSATQSLPSNDYKAEMESLIKRRFASEPGKPGIKSFIDRFTKDNSNTFDVDKIISFGEGIGIKNIESLLKSIAGQQKSVIGDDVIKYLILKKVYPKLKRELQNHINYLIKKGKLKKDDYFYSSDGKSSIEKGLYIWRVSFPKNPDPKVPPPTSPPTSPTIVKNLVSDSGFKGLTTTYTNIMLPNGQLNPNKPSKNNSWVIEDKDPSRWFVEIKFVPFTK